MILPRARTEGRGCRGPDPVLEEGLNVFFAFCKHGCLLALELVKPVENRLDPVQAILPFPALVPTLRHELLARTPFDAIRHRAVGTAIHVAEWLLVAIVLVTIVPVVALGPSSSLVVVTRSSGASVVCGARFIFD